MPPTFDPAFAVWQAGLIQDGFDLVPPRWVENIKRVVYDRRLTVLRNGQRRSVPAVLLSDGTVAFGPAGATRHDARRLAVHEAAHMGDRYPDGIYGRLSHHFQREQLERWSFVNKGIWDGAEDEREGVAVIFEWLLTLPWALRRKDPDAWEIAAQLIWAEGGTMPEEALEEVRVFDYRVRDVAWWGEIPLRDLLKQTQWDGAEVTNPGGRPVYMTLAMARTGILGRSLQLWRTPLWCFRVREGATITRTVRL